MPSFQLKHKISKARYHMIGHFTIPKTTQILSWPLRVTGFPMHMLLLWWNIQNTDIFRNWEESFVTRHTDPSLKYSFSHKKTLWVLVESPSSGCSERSWFSYKKKYIGKLIFHKLHIHDREASWIPKVKSEAIPGRVTDCILLRCQAHVCHYKSL